MASSMGGLMRGRAQLPGLASKEPKGCGGWMGGWRSEVSGFSIFSGASSAATAPASICTKRLLELENDIDMSMGGLGVSSKGSGVRRGAELPSVPMGVLLSPELVDAARLGNRCVSKLRSAA